MEKEKKIVMIPQEKLLPCFTEQEYLNIKAEYERYGNKIKCHFEPETYYGLVEVTTYRIVRE